MAQDFFRTSINDESFIRGAARILWAGVTVSFPSTIGNVINLSTYNAQTGWNDLGATKSGITISVNNSEDTFDVDQIKTEIASQPSDWQVTVTTNIAEVTADKLQLAWEGGTLTSGTDADGLPVKTLGFGAPETYQQRRLAVLFKKPSGKIRMFAFRIVQKTPTQSDIVFNKSGDQQSIPMSWRALADTSVSDIYQRFFMVKDQI